MPPQIKLFCDVEPSAAHTKPTKWHGLLPHVLKDVYLTDMFQNENLFISFFLIPPCRRHNSYAQGGLQYKIKT